MTRVTKAAGDDTPLHAGDFSAWLEGFRASLLVGGAVEVPCGDCVACCTSSYFVHVGPADTRTLARVPAELLFPAPGAAPGTRLLGYDEDGRCPLLRGRRCYIYEDRPATCRLYDCRLFAATGIAADRDAIRRQARRWRFALPAERDRRAHEAVRAAARFLREHAECFPGRSAPSDPADVAVTAVKVFDVFLGQGDGYDGSGRTSRDLARAVVDAAECFETRRSAPATTERKAGA